MRNMPHPVDLALSMPRCDKMLRRIDRVIERPLRLGDCARALAAGGALDGIPIANGPMLITCRTANRKRIRVTHEMWRKCVFA